MGKVERKTLGLYGHTVKVNESKRPKMVMVARPEGLCSRRKTRLEWKKWVVEVAGGRGKNMREIRQSAIDRYIYQKCLKNPNA